MDAYDIRKVRAVVSNTDDPTIPVSTLRAWVIGLIFAAGGSACNQFFSPRQPAITLSVYVAQVLAFPVGKVRASMHSHYRILTLPLSGLGEVRAQPLHDPRTVLWRPTYCPEPRSLHPEGAHVDHVRPHLLLLLVPRAHLVH